MSRFHDPIWTDENRRGGRNSRRLLIDPQVFGASLQAQQMAASSPGIDRPTGRQLGSTHRGEVDRPLIFVGRDHAKAPGCPEGHQGFCCSPRAATPAQRRPCRESKGPVPACAARRCEPGRSSKLVRRARQTGCPNDLGQSKSGICKMPRKSMRSWFFLLERTCQR